MNQDLSPIFYASWVGSQYWEGPDFNSTATMTSISNPSNYVMLTDAFDAPWNLAGCSAFWDDWRMVQNRSTSLAITTMDGSAHLVHASTTQYEINAATTNTSCWSWFSNAGPQETPGSPIASCALDNTSAPFYFEPRTGTGN
jgi:hypothetical protein